MARQLPPVWLMTLLLFLIKFVLMLLARGLYPFADAFKERLGVSRDTFFFILAAGELAGLGAPMLGVCGATARRLVAARSLVSLMVCRVR